MKKIILALSVFIYSVSISENVARKISVTGVVEREITPDVANINFQIVTKNKELKLAADENKKIFDKFKNDLNSKGIKLESIETNNYYTDKVYDDEAYQNIKKENEKNKVEIYTTTLGFIANIKEFENIANFISIAQKNKLSVSKLDSDNSFLYSFNISASDSNQKTSYEKALNLFDKIKEDLKTININDDSILLNNYENNKGYKSSNNKNETYYIDRVSNDFTIQIKGLNSLNDIMTIAENNNINLSNLSFDISNKKEIESEIYKDAFEQAQSKALSILKSSNMSLQDPIVISESSDYQYKAVADVDDYSRSSNKEYPVMMASKNASLYEIDVEAPRKKVDFKPQNITISKNLSVLFEIK